MGLGDPSIDLSLAWSFATSTCAKVVSHLAGVDYDAWVRGSGWALSSALIALPCYKDTNLRLADSARQVIREILADRLARQQARTTQYADVSSSGN